ncbi:MAG: hypothetical protein WHU94_08640 [Thermogemmata sp.]
MRTPLAAWTAPLVLLGTTAAAALVQPAAPPKLDPALVQKQKEQLKGHLAKVKISGVHVVETPHFLFASTLEGGKVQAMQGPLEKLVPVARSALALPGDEMPWAGKLAICYLPEPRDFRTFVREVLREQPERVHYRLNAEAPLLVTSGQAIGAATEAERQQVVLAQVAEAFLRGRYPQSQFPAWLTCGFGRVCLLRADGLKSPRYAAYRKQVLQLIRENRLKPSDLLGEQLPERGEVLANSFVEFLAFGPEANNFPALLSGFRPDENGQVPSAVALLERLGLVGTAFEERWRNWVLGKLPAPKKDPVRK